MPKSMQIDIVSDVSCPWCVIGYYSLQQALAELQQELQAEVQWLPFELNPQMVSEGEEINQHLARKYAISEAQMAQNRQHIQQRGMAVGYAFGERGGGRIYNTFDAHRLLHWAGLAKQQTALKLALFDLYFKQGGNPSDHQQLLQVVEQVGLDVNEAADILNSSRYQPEVRQLQQHYQNLGIQSVPAFIINQRQLISGGQPPEVFVSALRQIAAETADAE